MKFEVSYAPPPERDCCEATRTVRDCGHSATYFCILRRGHPPHGPSGHLCEGGRTRTLCMKRSPQGRRCDYPGTHAGTCSFDRK